MNKLSITSRWDCQKWSAIMEENSEKNSGLQSSNAMQFYFGTIIRKKQYEFTPDIIETFSKYTLVKRNDIMINGLNLNYDFVSQRVGLVKEDGIMTSAYLCMRVKINQNPMYYCYLLKAMDSRKMFHGIGTGIRLTLSYNELRNIFLPVPPREEQDQIVRFLDWKVSEVNKLIAKYRKEILSLEELKAKIINDAVIKGLKNTPLKHNKDIRWDIDYCSTWNLARVRELFSFRKGLSITKANLEETGIPVISYGQVHSKNNTMVGLNDDILKFVNPSYLESHPSCLVTNGDFIFADTSEDKAGCGNCAYVDRDGEIFAGYHSIIVHPLAGTDKKYFAYLFKSPAWRYQIRKKVNGVKVYSITQQILKDAFVLLPPEDEQREIVNYLDGICHKIDALIKKTEEKIAQLHDLKATIISGVVTGNIDVRNVEIPEYEYEEEDSEDEVDIESVGDEIEELED